MKDLLSKEHCCYKIHIFFIKISAFPLHLPPTPPPPPSTYMDYHHFYKKILIPPFYDFSKIPPPPSLPLNIFF